MIGVQILQSLFSQKLDRKAQEFLNNLKREDQVHFKIELERTLEKLRKFSGPNVLFGKEASGEKISVPLDFLFNHSLCVGASGAGKSYLALLIFTNFLKSKSPSMGMGILDPKGELFKKALDYLYFLLSNVDPLKRKELEKKIYVIDFSSFQFITPYNILRKRGEESTDFLINSRLDALCDIFQGPSSLTVRMQTMLKHFLMLMREFGLPLSFFDRLCQDQILLTYLASKSKNERTKAYFLNRFSQEARTTTLLALRQRIDYLLSSQGVRLSLSASGAPNFRKMMDEGSIVLINTSGKNIARATSHLLQALILSDLRQAVFQRKNTNKFLWILDESQVLYRFRSTKENLLDLLSMSRSFGTFFLQLTQTISSAVQDPEVLNSIMTNVRWILMLRSTIKDAKLITPAIPIKGNLLKPKRHLFEERRYLNPKEELRLKLEEITGFPDRIGYLWFKGISQKAIKIKTNFLSLPCSGKIKEIELNKGFSRDQIEKEMKKMSSWLDSLSGFKVSSSPLNSHPGSEGMSLVKLLEKEYLKKINKKDVVETCS